VPKVSVIIPNFNHDRFLPQRIQSILDQTFQDFEIIFLDDCSTDNSKKVFSNYSNHPKISHAIFNEINSNSTFKQWNTGISLAVGKYIWIAESDDYADPLFLEKLVPILEINHNVGLAYSQSFLVSEKNEIISPNFLSCTECLDLERWTSDYLNCGKNECSKFLAGKNTIPNASAVLIRKAIYESEVGRNNEGFKVAGDWFTWSKILLASDVYFVSESLNYFRSCEGSVSRNTSKLILIIKESFSIFDQIQERIDISQKAQEIFFKLVSNWWITYFVVGGNFSWAREVNSCQQILKISPHYTGTLYFCCQLLLIPLNRFRYVLGLRKWVNIFMKHIEYLLSNIILFFKF
jgi:glycosyltransferase involved in cell wall biosynthesis